MNSVIQSQIGRIVAFVLTPILLPVSASVATWIQDIAGLDLDGADLTAYVVAVVAGVTVAVYKWLSNRGEWERVIEYINRTHDAGAEVVDPVVDPAPDAGVGARRVTSARSTTPRI